ncbi:hypothetical protein K438DRAFT_1995776 [Mycena galopus ATCC 62051]|nr:hypothetical protein K438DRAFT_1995776 [Mycena galopus ATCC 62051]
MSPRIYPDFAFRLTYHPPNAMYRAQVIYQTIWRRCTPYSSPTGVTQDRGLLVFVASHLLFISLLLAPDFLLSLAAICDLNSNQCQHNATARKFPVARLELPLRHLLCAAPPFLPLVSSFRPANYSYLCVNCIQARLLFG